MFLLLSFCLQNDFVKRMLINGCGRKKGPLGVRKIFHRTKRELFSEETKLFPVRYYGLFGKKLRFN